jgi:hypothetical protein
MSSSDRDQGKKWKIDRRTFLRCAAGGMAAALPLPLLDIMGRQAFAAAAGTKRFGMIYFSNGININKWWPTGDAANYSLAGTSLNGFEGVKDYMRVIRGINADSPNTFGHGRALSGFLTARAPADPKIIKNTISLDQAVANAIKGTTRVPSVQVTGQNFKYVDDPWISGLNAACSFNANGTLNDNDDNAPRIFDRLFGGTNTGSTVTDATRRKILKKSILDTIINDRVALDPKLSSEDRIRMDEYYSNLRSVEQRIQTTQTPGEAVACAFPATKPPNLMDDAVARANGYNGTINNYDMGAYWDIMFDMLVLAFQCDLTRVFTFPMGTEGSGEEYRSIGLPIQYHFNITHHGGDATKLTRYAAVNEYHAKVAARFIQKLKDSKEGAGNLLDNSAIIYGGGLENGDQHVNYNIPFTLFGKGGGAIRTNYVHKVNGVHIGNVHASLLNDVYGVQTATFGAGNGRLSLG